MIFVPNLILEYATTYQMPTTVSDYVGIVVGGFGIRNTWAGSIYILD